MSEEHDENIETQRDALDAIIQTRDALLNHINTERINSNAFFSEYEQTPYIEHETHQPFNPISTHEQQTNDQSQQQSNEESNLIHTCYVCKSNILKQHALGMYYNKKKHGYDSYFFPHIDYIDQQTKHEFNKIWNSKHIKFLCCKCVEEMLKVDKSRKEEIKLLQDISKTMILLGFNTIDLDVIIDDLKNKLENNELPHFIELKELHEQLKKKHTNIA